MRKAIWILGMLVVAGGATALTVANTLCVNDPVDEIQAPGGWVRAVVFNRHCGATTDFSTQVSIVPWWHGVPPWAWGNLFIADTDDGRALAAPWGGPIVELRWLNDSELLLRHHRGARVFRAERHGQN